MKTEPMAVGLVLGSSFIGSFGAVFLKSGANRLKKDLAALLTNWRLAAGILAYVVSSVFYVIAIKHGELSVLYPMVSLNFLWTLIWSRLFFQEPLTKNKFMGLGMILFGIVLLGIGNR